MFSVPWHNANGFRVSETTRGVCHPTLRWPGTLVTVLNLCYSLSDALQGQSTMCKVGPLTLTSQNRVMSGGKSQHCALSIPHTQISGARIPDPHPHRLAYPHRAAVEYAPDRATADERPGDDG